MQTRLQLTILRAIVIQESVKDASGQPLKLLLKARIQTLNRFLKACDAWLNALAAVEQSYSGTENASLKLIPLPLSHEGNSTESSGSAGAGAIRGFPAAEASDIAVNASCPAETDTVQNASGPAGAADETDSTVPISTETGTTWTVAGPGAGASAETVRIDESQQQFHSQKLSAQVAAASADLSDRQKWTQTELHGDLLTAGAGFNGTFLVNNLPGGRSETKISSRAEAKAQAAALQGNSRIGTDDWNVYSKSEAAVAGAAASAQASVEIGANRFAGISAGAEAEAYLAKGEVTFGHSFHGVRIELSAEGLAGVQAEVKGKLSTQGVSGKVGLGPIGAGIKVDWSKAGLEEN